MTVFHGGRAFYGQPMGIMMSDAVVPRLPGDIGNAFTFDFPVRYRRVSGAHVKRYVANDQDLLKEFVVAAQELESEGVRAITVSCGFGASFQQALADCVGVPLFASSLLQVPMVSRMLRRDQKVAILTADSRFLNPHHYEQVGIVDIPFVAVGSENTPAFYDCFVRDTDKLDYEAARAGIVELIGDTLRAHPDIGAVVCEGSNFALFRGDVQAAHGIPFFDIVTLTRMVYQAVTPLPLPARTLLPPSVL